jgi:replicative DNA helicase
VVQKTWSRAVDEEAESYVVGALILRPALLADIDLSATEFGHPETRKVYQAIYKIDADGEVIDPLAIERESGVGFDRISQFIDSVPTVENYKYYVELVRQKAITRATMKACHDVTLDDREGDDLLAYATEALAAIDVPTSITDAVPAGLAARDMMDDMRAAVTGERKGITTGCEQWDDYGWIEHGDVMTIAARPSMGKSALVCWLIVQLISVGHKVLIFLTEGNRKKLMRRLVAQITPINSRDIRRGRLSYEQLGTIRNAVERINDWPLYIDDSRYNILDIKRQARKCKTRHGIDVIIVDHLQEVRSTEKGSDFERMNDVIEGLRMIAQEEPKVAMIQACQLNRECEASKDKRPAVHHLRASGRIEEISDVIALLYRPWRYFPESEEHNPDEMEVNFGKVRDDEVGCPTFSWDINRGLVRGPMSNRSPERSR